MRKIELFREKYYSAAGNHSSHGDTNYLHHNHQVLTFPVVIFRLYIYQSSCWKRSGDFFFENVFSHCFGYMKLEIYSHSLSTF